jgi:hypothetical protein
MNVPPREVKIPVTPLYSQFRGAAVTWFLASVTGVWLVLTLVYTFAASSSDNKLASLVPMGGSAAITALRILTEGSAILLTALIASTLEIVQWAASCSKDGITISSILGISPSTRLFGLFSLLRWRTTLEGKDHHLTWVGMRILFIGVIPIMSIIIFSKASIYVANFKVKSTRLLHI